MTPGARLQAAIEVLGQWQTGTPAERALTQWARGARYAGSKDRRAVRDHVYDVLRQKGVCAALGGGESPRHWVLGLVRLTGSEAAALFSGEGYGPQALNVQEAALVAQEPSIDRAADTPDWLRAQLSAQYGDQVEAITEAMARRAPLYLRVNLAKSDPTGAIASLAKDGIAATAHPACHTALEVETGGPKLPQSQAFMTGLVEPQDLSVQIACAGIDWPDGAILDYCAGGGGKALAIAAATGGPVDVHDTDPRRMSDIPARAARAGADLRPVDPVGPYDLVLTDVPCSGSGTWRRDPEAKWRLTPDDLRKLVAVQDEILRDAARLVRAGGRLVYMTCSLLEEENGARLEAFVATHSGWRLSQTATLTPLTASDGFFAATLVNDC